MGKSRRTFLFRTAALAGGGAFSYGFLWESSWLRVREFSVPVKGLRDSVRLLHMSDFHASRDVPWSLIEEGIMLGLGTEPDMICLTGDFVTRKIHREQHYANLLKRCSQLAPTVAVLGNHDGGEWAKRHRGYDDLTVMSQVLEDAEIDLLENDSVAHLGIQFVGLGDLWSEDSDPARAFAGVDDRHPVVVLAHNPDAKDEMDASWDLMLSGHTHGGQVRVPLIGLRPVLPVKDRRFVDGLYRWNDRSIHVTRGVGNIWHCRFYCRPEVSVLNLVPT